MNKLLKIIVPGIVYTFLNIQALCQCLNTKQLYDNISITVNDARLSNAAKLQLLYKLKRVAEDCKLTNDTAYILLLLKTGSYENDINKAITLTSTALQVNRRSSKSLQQININAYFNLATYYQILAINNKALNYYDSVLLLVNPANDPDHYALDSRYYKTRLFFLQGDYQQAVEESTLGMNLALTYKDSSTYLYFLNQKAQSFCFENYLEQSLSNVRPAIILAKQLKDKRELATAYKTTGLTFEKTGAYDSAKFYLESAIKTRLSTGDEDYIASDYNDFGNFYLNSLHDFKNAAINYRQALMYAGKMQSPVDRSLKIALTNLNLGENYLRQKKLVEASNYYIKSFANLNINLHNDIKENALSIKLSGVGNKDLIIPLMQNKTHLLLELFKSTHNRDYLKACIKTSFVTDSVITQIRHEEIGEQSKLHWRNKTRNFFTLAMEACYQANDPATAFYFMERSRAVLLTDQLNEIGAAAILPKTETAKQRNYQDNLVELERELLTLNESSAEYQHAQIAYFSEKANFERYIDSLEIAYPIYYQYKYADKVPTIKELQSFLAKSNQSFVHYYMDDSVTYILAITPSLTQFQKLSVKQFDRNTMLQFLQLCSNKQALNNNYASYIQLSNNIYTSVFQPLQLPKGRTIICSDNIVIPFEALCTDADGKHFLISDYSFSYVYSARFLMKKVENITASGNFIGFAPVSFRDNLHVAELKNADKAMHAAASYYKNDKLLTHENASRSNFFRYAPSYSIVSIFSHAFADTTDNEPKLYMQDSLIYLSELQRLNNPAIRLVLLSACQTNVGRAATGEGIYSLARGFATAGIPSVAATLWKADEQTIYAISEKFNEYLSEGMTKDEALQKAKLYFVQNNSNNEKLLPYYWANMILIGNAEAIKLSSPASNYWWFAGFVLIPGIIILITKKNLLLSKIKK